MPRRFYCHFPVYPFHILNEFFFSETSLSRFSATSASSSDCHPWGMTETTDPSSFFQCIPHPSTLWASARSQEKNSLRRLCVVRRVFLTEISCRHWDVQRAVFKGFLTIRNMTWFSFKGKVGNRSQNWSALLWMESGLCLDWSPLSGSGSVPSCFLSLCFKGSCCPSEMLALVEMTQFQNQYPLRQMWGAIFFLHRPWGKGGKNSQLLHQLSRWKSSKVNWRQQMIPFAAEWDLQADNGKHWANRTMKTKFDMSSKLKGERQVDTVSLAYHKPIIKHTLHLEVAWFNWVPSITLFS